MATITQSSLGDLLKRLYSGDEIQRLVNLTAPALERCASKGSAQLGGTNLYFPIMTESAHGHAYIAESQALPAGRQATHKQAVVAPTVHAGVVQLTGLSMSVSSGNAMAFARAFEENVSQTIASMTMYKEGALFRTGDGVLTQFNGAVATSAGPHTVDDPNHLREGMVVDLIDASATTRHNTNIKVQSIDWAGKTVTFTTAVAAAVDDNDRIFIADSQNDTGALQTVEPIGLAASVDSDNTYLGINRTAAGNANWAAAEITASAFMDESLLLRGRTQLIQEAGVDLGGFSSFGLLCHPMVSDTLFKLAIPRIEYAPGGSFDLGNSSNPSFGGIDLITSWACPPGTAYLGDWQYHNTLYTPGGELHIDTQYNNSALKWVATQDVGLVFIKEYCNFALRKPVCFLKYTSLTEQTR